MARSDRAYPTAGEIASLRLIPKITATHDDLKPREDLESKRITL